MKHTISAIILNKLYGMPTEFFQSNDGRYIVAKSYWHIKKVEGAQAAKQFINEIMLLSLLP